jgi:thiol-disulfide isomerase/thioredoxin
MTKSILALILAAGAAFSAQIPRQAPEFAIHMPNGSQKLLSSYRGKTVVMAFVFTTCPHCQRMMGTLGGIQKEYAARGVQVLASAFNDIAKDPGSSDFVGRFATTYVSGFPAGWNEKLSVLEFLQHDEKIPYFVPILVFIDKRGVIREQVLGDEKYLGDPETNVRASIDAVLKASAAPAPVHKKTVTTSSTK